MSSPRSARPASFVSLAATLLVIVAAAILYSQGGSGLLSELTPTPEPTVTEEPGSIGQPGNFDFYILVLSWSPEYCNSTGNQDSQQCSVGRKLGFVLHGLWPEYDKGYPSNCSTARLPENVKTKYAGLYPSPALFDHEWEKHGTCSGLSPDSYLALSRKLKESVLIPSRYQSPEQPVRVSTAQLKQDLVAANTKISESALAPFCSGSGRYLQELYVCFTTEGQPRACSTEIQRNSSRSCASPDFVMRNVR